MLRTEPWSARSALVLGTCCVAVLVGGFGLWGLGMPVTGAVIAQGRVEVAENRQVVQHPQGGVVAAILVREGDVVPSGHPLIRLDDRALRSELAVVEGQLHEVLSRRARLEAEEMDASAMAFDPLLRASGSPLAAEFMAGAEALFAAGRETARRETEQLRQQQEQLDRQAQGFSAQMAALETQVALVGRELDVQAGLLDRGLARSSRVMELERERASLQGRLGAIRASRAQALGRITEIEIQILRGQAARREDASAALRDLGYLEIELRERRRNLMEQLDRLEIRAPMAGVVYGLQVFGPRSVVRPADPLLHIVPQDRPLVVVARLDPIHVDEVAIGQEVLLRFSAFDERSTPELRGRVVRVSADVFQEGGASLPYYRAEVELADGEAARLPEGLPLLPGMPVEAFIRTGERTPVDFLLQPLTDFLETPAWRT